MSKIIHLNYLSIPKIEIIHSSKFFFVRIGEHSYLLYIPLATFYVTVLRGGVKTICPFQWTALSRFIPQESHSQAGSTTFR